MPVERILGVGDQSEMGAQISSAAAYLRQNVMRLTRVLRDCPAETGVQIPVVPVRFDVLQESNVVEDGDRAVEFVDQADIELLDEAMQGDKQPRAILQLDAFPNETLTSQVIEVAKVELQDAPARLSSKVGGELNTQTDATGDQRPMSTSYQARVPLDDQGKLQGLLCTGMRGRAKVATRSQSLGKRLSRYISRTFHFEL